MFTNQYYIEMKITKRVATAFTVGEIQMLNNARIAHNTFFSLATRQQTRNRKYISKIITNGNIIGFYLETEYPIMNTQRIGNALRMFSIFASNSGLGTYVLNQRLMKSA